MAALTAAVKDELCLVPVGQSSTRMAEIATLIRFGGQMESAHKELTIRVECDHPGVARRLAGLLKQAFDLTPQLVHTRGSARRPACYAVEFTDRAAEIARQLGLIDRQGRAVRGLPARVVSGSTEDAKAVTRAAFLISGSLTESGRASAMEITCPCPEAALALVGACRRLEIIAKNKEARGSDRLLIRDGEAISTLLGLMGASAVIELWQQRLKQRESRVAAGSRLANFDDANLRRSARAAVAAAARVERALEILGEDVPEHLRTAGQLRIEHRQASLEELGQLADPQMTKDAVAGRIRRLLSMADKKAEDEKIPNTHSAVTPDMLDEA